MGVLVLQERPQYFEVAQDVGRGDVEDVLVEPSHSPRRRRKALSIIGHGRGGLVGLADGLLGLKGEDSDEGFGKERESHGYM